MVRNRTIQIRITRDQYERIKNYSRVKGFSSLSSYLRFVALEQDLVLRQKIREIHEHPPAQSEEESAGEEDKSLETLLQEKVDSLSDILFQITRDIQSRKALSENVIYRIYQHYLYIKSKLFELYQWELGINRGVETRRVRLERQLDTLKQEKRREQVVCWQDVASLQKEFRQWFKQYCDLVQRVRLVIAPTKEKACCSPPDTKPFQHICQKMTDLDRRILNEGFDSLEDFVRANLQWLPSWQRQLFTILCKKSSRKLD